MDLAVAVFAPARTPFLQHAEEEGLVRLLDVAMPEHTVFDRAPPCACRSKDGLAIHDEGGVVVAHDHLLVRGSSCYSFDRLDPDRDYPVAVSWLIRNKFLTFHSTIENGSLVRFLSPNQLFRRRPTSCACVRYDLVGEPVYCLKQSVLSFTNKGPTLESVLQKCPK